MQHKIRIELSQLKNEKVRECYNKKLTNDMAKIDPAENLEKHEKKPETAIKKAAMAIIPGSRSAKKPWIFEDTLKLADEGQKEQQYKDLYRKVKILLDKIKSTGYSNNQEKSKRV